MAFKFNNGNGAVICDKCRVIIEFNISHDRYNRKYRRWKRSKTKDLCIDHKPKKRFLFW